MTNQQLYLIRNNYVFPPEVIQLFEGIGKLIEDFESQSSNSDIVSCGISTSNILSFNNDKCFVWDGEKFATGVWGIQNNNSKKLLNHD